MWSVVETSEQPLRRFRSFPVLSLLKPISKHYNELKHRLVPFKHCLLQSLVAFFISR